MKLPTRNRETPNFLSDMEQYFFLTFEFLKNMVVIYEQLPLGLNQALLIAEQLRTKHSLQPRQEVALPLKWDIYGEIKEVEKLRAKNKLLAFLFNRDEPKPHGRKPLKK